MMNDKIYILRDIDEGKIISIHKTMLGAREALIAYLKGETGYMVDEWRELAISNGYDSIESFQDAMLTMPDYDDDMIVEIEEYTLQD